ncbi:MULTISPECIES: ATP-binding protein [unclassified Acinetobacter]|uniref:sensor histidine kinase n=1 Tax=unclassified Acinetobacter TaxID=196816 RepID=UPI002576168C|nr:MULTISPECIES: ATP-binding protein [unclassified Acinetobacter]MDM1765230.1 two-component sensor histidine kinase [Acinetobacter sp. 226-1]MDM1768735.1 two-component sensor histidine kinase [Acinetobacter sp. 226-4]
MKKSSKKVVSLQNKLIKTAMMSSILASLIALIALLGFSIYQAMSVQDEIMDEISDMLLISDIRHQAGQQLDELSDEFDIEYRLALQQQTLTQSATFKTEYATIKPFWLSHSSYGFAWFNGEIWRIYQAEKTEDHLHVLVMQPLQARFKDTGNSLLLYGGILLVLWLIQGLILYILLQKQFRLFKSLSQEISLKNINDLTPVHAEIQQFKELQPLLEQLNFLLARLDHSLLAEQRFTADASHELRSPLSAIQMRLQVLKRKYHDLVELQPDLASIQQDVYRGTQVLENLLLLARLDPTQATQLPSKKVNVRMIVDTVIASFTESLQQKNVQLHVQYHDIELNVNEELFFICFRNLLDNAIRYAPFGGTIELEMQENQNNVEWRIENQGSGLTQDLVERLGERFYRILGNKTQGSGLGLSICKKIMALHQGQILLSISKLGGLKVQLIFMK